MIPFNVISSQLKFCSFSNISFLKIIYWWLVCQGMWTVGRLVRSVGISWRALKIWNQKNYLFYALAVYESGTWWFESKLWNEVSTSLRSNPGARQWSPRAAGPAPLGWCQWTHPMLRDQSWSGTACQTSFSSSWGQFKVNTMKAYCQAVAMSW